MHTLTKHKEGIYAVALDNMNIIYQMNAEKTSITVIKIMLAENSKLNTGGANKLRTREWLEKVSEFIDFGNTEILESPSTPLEVKEQNSSDVSPAKDDEEEKKAGE